MFGITGKLLAVFSAVFCLAAADAARAHVIAISWDDIGGGNVRFFAGDYHSNSPPALFGGIIIDGLTYFFDARITDADYVANYEPGIDGRYDAPNYTLPAGILHWQYVDVPDLLTGNHSLTTTSTTAVEEPWPGDFPTTQFITVVRDSIPEPGTLALFGIGLAGLGLARRRKTA